VVKVAPNPLLGARANSCWALGLADLMNLSMERLWGASIDEATTAALGAIECVDSRTLTTPESRSVTILALPKP